MNWLMKKCSRCGRYTLVKDKCPYCNGELISPHPPRYSLVDKYVEYRVKMKLEKKLLNLDEKPSYIP